MPGKSLSPGAVPQAGIARSPAATGAHKVLHTVDATLPAGSAVSGVEALTSVATSAVRAGGGHVLDSSHVLFPNGAVTLVLILAESHLAIHTWPEEDRIAIDLFSCGAIDAGRVTAQLVRELGLTGVLNQRVERGAAPPRPAPAQAGTDSDRPN